VCHDVCMRTTLSLEPDVAELLKTRIEEQDLSLKFVVNQALRTGLAAMGHQSPTPFQVEPHAFGMKPGIDPDKLNQLVDDLEVEEFERKNNR
jgi:hypothetical protein